MLAIQRNRHLKFSIFLPILGFVASLIILYPSRNMILSEILFAYRAKPVDIAFTPLTNLYIQILTATASSYESSWEEEDRRIAKITALNLPALVSDLPVAIFSRDHESWHPHGIDFKTWHAISYPLVGIFFWWLLGRGFDCLRGKQNPFNHIRTAWIELVLATVILTGTLALCIGWIFTTTPEDRGSLALRWFAGGSALWLVLESFAVAGWLAYFKRKRKHLKLQATSTPSP